jgi:hypothetical protein
MPVEAMPNWREELGQCSGNEMIVAEFVNISTRCA